MKESSKFYPVVDTEARDERNIPEIKALPFNFRNAGIKATDRIEPSWIFEALQAILDWVEASLEDDGKISGSEVFNLVMQLFAIIGQLLAGKR